VCAIRVEIVLAGPFDLNTFRFKRNIFAFGRCSRERRFKSTLLYNIATENAVDERPTLFEANSTTFVHTHTQCCSKCPTPFDYDVPLVYRVTIGKPFESHVYYDYAMATVQNCSIGRYKGTLKSTN